MNSNKKSLFAGIIFLILFLLTFSSFLYILSIVIVGFVIFYKAIRVCFIKRYDIKLTLFLILLSSLSIFYHYKYNQSIKLDLLNEKNNILLKHRDLTKEEIIELYQRKIMYIKDDKGFVLMKNGIDLNVFIIEEKSDLIKEMNND